MVHPSFIVNFLHFLCNIYYLKLIFYQDGCGFQTDSERTQIYKLHPIHGDICLAGTSEIPLASLFNNSMIHIEELPRKLATVSRCYRAEVSDIERERGIYRVHQFTKVEMFALTAQETGEESSEMLDIFSSVQAEIFSGIGLHFKILDMPTLELGLPAYRKYDIEVWMPAKKFYGEVSRTFSQLKLEKYFFHFS